MGSLPKIKGAMDPFFKGHGDSRLPFFVVSKGHQKFKPPFWGAPLKKTHPLPSQQFAGVTTWLLGVWGESTQESKGWNPGKRGTWSLHDPLKIVDHDPCWGKIRLAEENTSTNIRCFIRGQPGVGNPNPRGGGGVPNFICLVSKQNNVVFTQSFLGLSNLGLLSTAIDTP